MAGSLPSSAVLREAMPATSQPEDVRFRATFDANLQFVGRCLLRFGVRPADVEDATQQVFLVVSQKLSTIWPGKERAFAGAVAARVASHFRRSQAQVLRNAGPLEADVLLDPSPTPEDAAQTKRARARLDAILDEMSPLLREVFVLFELEGLSTPEIAEFLEIPRGTAASRLRLAREHFVKRCTELSGEGS